MTKNKGETGDKIIEQLWGLPYNVILNDMNVKAGKQLAYNMSQIRYEMDCRLIDKPGREVKTILDSLYGLL